MGQRELLECGREVYINLKNRYEKRWKSQRNLATTSKTMIKKFTLTLGPMFTVVILDQLSKSWARALDEPLFWGKFKLSLVYNNGIFLGYFSHLPLNAKEIILITLGTFSIIVYVLLLWLLPIKSKSTYMGLSIFVGGILGNVIDRFNGFSVVDFISLHIPGTNTPYVNIADFSQWMGTILISIGLYRDSSYYWPKKDWRTKYIINPYFQFRSAALITFFTFSSAALILIFSYAFLKNVHNQEIMNYFFSVGFFIILTFSTLIFLFSVILTHRVAGPIHAIQRHLRELKKGTQVNFKLREYDEFKEIEKDLNYFTRK